MCIICNSIGGAVIRIKKKITRKTVYRYWVHHKCLMGIDQEVKFYNQRTLNLTVTIINSVKIVEKMMYFYLSVRLKTVNFIFIIIALYIMLKKTSQTYYNLN